MPRSLLHASPTPTRARSSTARPPAAWNLCPHPPATAAPRASATAFPTSGGEQQEPWQGAAAPAKWHSKPHRRYGIATAGALSCSAFAVSHPWLHPACLRKATWTVPIDPACATTDCRSQMPPRPPSPPPRAPAPSPLLPGPPPGPAPPAPGSSTPASQAPPTGPSISPNPGVDFPSSAEKPAAPVSPWDSPVPPAELCPPARLPYRTLSTRCERQVPL